MSRFRLLSDAQWSLIADLLPVRTDRQGRPFRDARQVVEGIICRYRCGILVVHLDEHHLLPVEWNLDDSLTHASSPPEDGTHHQHRAAKSSLPLRR
jgi:hypothetical protein